MRRLSVICALLFAFGCGASPVEPSAPAETKSLNPPAVPSAPAPAPAAEERRPARRIDPAKLEGIDAAVLTAVRAGETPGAVALVLHEGEIVFLRAYGDRSQKPSRAPMSADTVFDLASLTKPIVTATSVVLLAERGLLNLSDRIARHLPEFATNGKDRVTIEELLLHTGGLAADNALRDYEGGRDAALAKIFDLTLETEPGTRFHYSDVGFLVLGALVERVSGERLDVFARKNIFEPLKMRDTAFLLSPEQKGRAAPAEASNPGEVHDPRALRMGGVAGHAGLFSTAGDLARFCAMILNQGELEGTRVLRPESVGALTRPREVPADKKNKNYNAGEPWLRALGWDVKTSMSGSRGALFPVGSFGHTGFTGTSMWLNPESRTAVILLTNRLHPDGKGNIARLRAEVATIAAGAILPAEPPVLTGLEVLKRDHYKILKNRRVGLITNHTGVDIEGNSSIDLLRAAPGVSLIALFSPEHGLRGEADSPVRDNRDPKTGLPVHSLYGPRNRPTPAQLKGIDTLVFDIQDAGARFYTYLTTLGLTLETAAEHKLRAVVLDRPNPVGGLAVEGPVLEPGRESFTGYHPLPIRHGMTFGELAGLLNKERKIGADLHVIPMLGFRRSMLFDDTGLRWINPSPNMKSLTSALLYPGIGLLETTNVSVGRGTDRPFQRIGAPFIDGAALAAALAAENLPGARFAPIRFTPSSSTHAGLPCGGVEIIVTDRMKLEPVRVGLAVAQKLRLLYPLQWKAGAYISLLAHAPAYAALLRGASVDAIEASYRPGLSAFAALRSAYLLYP